MELKLANNAILAYQRLPYKPWYAMAEFVDNSTDAYFRGNNKAILDEIFSKHDEKLTVEITYDKADGILRIADNSMGMSAAELESAMIIGEKPLVSSGRSEFGMGMKTAGIWFADTIEIRTKKLGEKEEVRTTIDIPSFVSGNAELEVHRTAKPSEQHYTIIELRNLKRKLGRAAFSKMRQHLGSIYRGDLRSGSLNLVVNDEPVELPLDKSDDAFLLRSNGTPYVVELKDIVINGKKVSGWIGVLKIGFGGRNVAGFSLIRHGRAIRGWLDSWRPEEIFGDASNDLINQRITGELFLDDFGASHTKDAIDWVDDDEEVLGTILRDKANEFGLLKEAKKTAKERESSEEASREKAESQNRFNAQVQTPKVQDTIRLLDVPKPELAKLAGEVLIDASADAEPVATWGIGESRTARLYELKLSPNDPYFEYEVLENADLRIIINSSHPAMNLLTSAEARLTHYHHVTLDAISEWKCTQQHEPLDPSSIRLMKDRLFRAISDVDTEL
jgi:hypothetical protein